ncbi:hypothetical protein HanOQP8_Chr03g0114671 [Helianthus annuus]|nr:hypothetical protein HanLR1_Chr03g0107291 [Helianthus annuus]KAJ0774678.1 hypothetical protein HanOQP8_Chr03g0114671 [Helianthus annuus]
MDPDCETEEVNLGGETQVVNLDTEFEETDALDNTQIFNDYDTEEVVVSDQEGSEKTEIVEDSELSDEDTCNIEHTQIIHPCNADIEEYNPKTDCRRSEQHTSGSWCTFEVERWVGRVETCHFLVPAHHKHYLSKVCKLFINI